MPVGLAAAAGDRPAAKQHATDSVLEDCISRRCVIEDPDTGATSDTKQVDLLQVIKTKTTWAIR